MEILSENQEYAISKFLKRYDYDAVLEILEEAGIIDGDLYFLIESCQYSVNFEFKRALEYIDFLGRLYRLKEALFKYIFVSTKESKSYKVSMHGYMVSKKNILYTLKKKYNIYSGNLIKGVTQYINRHVKKTKRMEKVVEILNNDRLESLIRLRNESPVGHGFKGISKEEIENIYGSPMEVMRDLVKACELLDLGISSNKYDDINEMAVHMIGSYENH